MSTTSDASADAPSPEEILVLDDERFTGDSVSIVTGAASGIGRATALAQAMNGLTVVGTDVDEDGLRETGDLAEELGAPGDVVTVAGNLTDEDDIVSVVETAADHGQVRFVANIAGLQHIAPIEAFPTEKFDLMQAVMVRAPFLLAKHAIPYIREADDGVGVVGNMCSIHGHVATQDKAAYITAKFGLRGVTQAIAAEGGGKIRAFTLSTSYLRTPLVDKQIPDTARERGITEEEVVEDVMLGGSRVKEMMTPIEAANVFTFGFSKHGKHLDGGDLPWDGGHVSTYE